VPTKFYAFLRLSRPLFLFNSIGLFSLGAMVARYEGYRIEVAPFLLGQLCLTALQLMSIYLNEYWDEDADRRNTFRTLFSGGSGVLAEGALTRSTVFIAALGALAIGVASGIALLAQQAGKPALWIMLLLIFLGLFFQSNRPVALTTSGYGEFTTSIVFAGLMPAFGHLVFADQASQLILLATAPLVVLHAAMLIAFSLPDVESDTKAEKRTLAVRVGQESAASIHNALLVLALLLAAVNSFLGLPSQVAISVAFIAPIAVLQIITLRRFRAGQPASFSQLTLLAALIYGLSVYLIAFSFWVLRQ
jgi:1,4-dihydroxy-2-naphthoate octaprenyltransferase